MGYYDVNVANVNRIVRFRVEATNAGDRDTGLFLALKGRASAYPHYGAVTGTPTANQLLAQLRLSMVVRALTAYSIPVGIDVVSDSAATGVGSAVLIAFETDESGVYLNQAWLTNPTGVAKHLTTDIVDQIGTPNGAGTGKTKKGLQSLLNDLATVSYDGGTTGPFGALSSTGNIVLPDGQVTSGAPVLSTGANAGLTISYVSSV